MATKPWVVYRRESAALAFHAFFRSLPGDRGKERGQWGETKNS
jgi:hypothetical protein